MNPWVLRSNSARGCCDGTDCDGGGAKRDPIIVVVVVVVLELILALSTLNSLVVLVDADTVDFDFGIADLFVFDINFDIDGLIINFVTNRSDNALMDVIFIHPFIDSCCKCS